MFRKTLKIIQIRDFLTWVGPSGIFAQFERIYGKPVTILKKYNPTTINYGRVIMWTHEIIRFSVSVLRQNTFIVRLNPL